MPAPHRHVGHHCCACGWLLPTAITASTAAIKPGASAVHCAAAAVSSAQCCPVLLFGRALPRLNRHRAPVAASRRLLQPGRQVRLQRLDQAAGPMRLRIQSSRNGWAVLHRSSSGYSWRPRPSTFSRVFWQHQLRLPFHVEAARGLEQAQQEVAEGDVFQRPLENRFTHSTDGGFEFVHPGIRRYPAGLDVQLRHWR